jgi:hypothetical protein
LPLSLRCEQSDRVFSDDAIAFIRAAIRSVWALEALRCLRAQDSRTWSAKALTQELRASELVIQEVLTIFKAIGLLSADADGAVRYAPVSPELDAVVGEIVTEYERRPIGVMKEIYAAETSKIQDFANAFRLKKNEKDER